MASVNDTILVVRIEVPEEIKFTAGQTPTEQIAGFIRSSSRNRIKNTETSTNIFGLLQAQKSGLALRKAEAKKKAANPDEDEDAKNDAFGQATKYLERAVALLFGTTPIDTISGKTGLQVDYLLSEAEADANLNALFKVLKDNKKISRVGKAVKAFSSGGGTADFKGKVLDYDPYSKDVKNPIKVGDVKIQGAEAGFSLNITGGVQTFLGEENQNINANIDDEIRALQADPSLVIKIIDENDALRQNVFSKTNRLLFTYQKGQKSFVTGFRVNWEHVKKFCKFTATPTGKGVKVDVRYPSDFVTKLINITDNAGKAYQKAVTTSDDGAISALFASEFGDQSLNIQFIEGSIVVANIKNFMKQPKALAKANAQKAEDKFQKGKFINAVQLTALLQRRIALKMPREGPPNPREGLKYRTGKFVDSLRFTANYKAKTITYFNLPPVDIYADRLHRRPYAVGQRLIGPTVRQFTKEMFGETFGVQRIS